MDCPNCKTTKLLMTDRLGIEIDYCPQCRGVWLDRGELDKIIERSSDAAPESRTERQSVPYSNRHDSDHEYHDSQRGGHYKKKKKEGFLSELFDFD
jgi:Zn-finger nucleic acid-binding protein